jgi:hypothetical protein
VIAIKDCLFALENLRLAAPDFFLVQIGNFLSPLHSE